MGETRCNVKDIFNLMYMYKLLSAVLCSYIKGSSNSYNFHLMKVFYMPWLPSLYLQKKVGGFLILCDNIGTKSSSPVLCFLFIMPKGLDVLYGDVWPIGN